MKRFCFLLIAALFLTAFYCRGEDKCIQFIVTGDMHGQLDKFARLAVVIREYPDAVKIDLGDIFQGEPAHDLANGEVMIEALNCLNYDFLIPGNHDFELTPEQFSCSYSRFRGTLLGQWLCGQLPVLKWKIIERNRIKCAVIGMTDHGMYKKRRFYPDYHFSPEMDAINAALKEIARNKVDIVVLARHGGDYFHGIPAGSFLYEHPEIDLLFCSHTHREIPGKRSGKCLIVQPGAYGSSAVLVTVKKSAVHGNIITSKLLRPTAKYPDRQLAALNAKMRKNLSSRLYTARFDIRSQKDFITAALKKLTTATGSDTAVIDMPELKNGKFTLNRMLKLFPYRNRLCVIKVSRKDYLAFIKERPPRSRNRYYTPVPNGKKEFTLALNSFQLNRSKCLKKYTANFRITPLIDRDIIWGKESL